MSELIEPAELMVADERQRGSRAEWAAITFLARYPNASTRRGYEISLQQWFRWCAEHGISPLDVRRPEIELFARELELTGRKRSTVGAKLNALAGFYRFALIDELITKNPMEHVSRPAIPRTSPTQGLTRTEFADVLRVAEQRPPRDHALVCLLGLNGLRISEACGIDIEHLGRFKGQRTARITRKGSKVQEIPMATRTAWAVEQCQGERDAGPLLLTRDGHRLDRKTAGRVVARIADEAGVRKRITPHSFRHTFVTMSLDAGMAERDIAASTGHADSRMIAYYDRNRDSMSRNTTHAVAAWVDSAS